MTIGWLISIIFETLCGLGAIIFGIIVIVKGGIFEDLGPQFIFSGVLVLLIVLIQFLTSTDMAFPILKFLNTPIF